MPMSDAYRALYQRSIDDPAAFWGEQAQRIDWQTPYAAVLDDARLPFARWFVGGRTNLCHNAVDRHLATRGEQAALVYVSTETGIETTYTYRALHREVNRMAACLQALGVRRGDRVLIYLPMIPEAAFAMLACARIGAIHSVVFGGFASNSLATRIDDATPRVIVSADAGSRGGKVVEYKPLLDAAIDLAVHKPAHVLLVDRKLAPMQHRPHDIDYAALARQHTHADVPCEWMESNEPSYILYTSGTTGKPKGVQRDTGGYAVALAASMPLIFGTQAGDTMFTASDVGWVVGHSYIVYAPLLAGLATVMYEGTPVRPDGAIWWRIVEQYRVNVMFTAPTAIRVLKKQDPALLRRHDLVQPAAPVPGRRAARRAHRALDRRRARQAHHRQLLADRDRLADAGDPAGRGALDAQAGLARLPGLRIPARHPRRGDGPALRAGRKGPAGRRRAAAAGLHEHRVGRRCTLPQDVLVRLPRAPALFQLRLGRAR